MDVLYVEKVFVGAMLVWVSGLSPQFYKEDFQSETIPTGWNSYSRLKVNSIYGNKYLVFSAISPDTCGISTPEILLKSNTVLKEKLASNSGF